MYVFQVLQYARLCPMFSYRLNLCNVQNFEIYLTNKKYYPWPALLPEWQYFPLSYASEHQKLGWFRETHFTITSSQPSNLGLLSFTSQTNWLSPQRKVFILLGRDFDLQLRGSFALRPHPDPGYHKNKLIFGIQKVILQNLYCNNFYKWKIY